jgi:ribonuclease Z
MRAYFRSFPLESPAAGAGGRSTADRGGARGPSADSNAADTLFAAAKDADLLLHDALSRTLLDPMIEAATELGLPLSGIMTDVIDYHAEVTLLPARAAEAGIQRLALYHLMPVPNALTERMFLRGLPDDVILTGDLHTFDLPVGSSEIRISEP